jgi:hypothetical protein
MKPSKRLNHSLAEIEATGFALRAQSWLRRQAQSTRKGVARGRLKIVQLPDGRICTLPKLEENEAHDP